MNFYYLVGNNMFNNILKNQIALIIISLLMFVLGFVNVIANIMNWQINEVFEFTQYTQ
jgi:succinate-acetate transporter protein